MTREQSGINREKSHTESLAGITVPESIMIGHPSKFANIWQPAPERIIVEEEFLKQQDVTVSIKKTCTGTLLDQRPEGKKAQLNLLFEKLRYGSVLDLGDTLVYDARYVFNDNLAHLIGHHVANLGFAKKHLGIGPGECTVVLGKQTSQMAHKLFTMLGYKTIETNRKVEANLLHVALDDLEAYLMIPYVPVLEPANSDKGGVEKLYVSRKTSRRISNEEEIWPLLKERGYERYYFEDIPMNKQWALIRDARSIVSTHGAALGYLSTKAGNREHSDYKILEIFSPGLVADIFRKTTAVVGGTWMCCRGRISSDFVATVEESDNVKGMDASDFELHPDTLKRALEIGQF